MPWKTKHSAIGYCTGRAPVADATTINCGSWLACDGIGLVDLKNRGVCIAGKPAPTYCGKQGSTQTIQACIDALRDKELVWKSSRGGYALEDKTFGDWLLHRSRAAS